MLDNVIEKLTKEVKNSVKGLTRDEARYLVNAYYMMQGHRIRSESQNRALVQSEKSNEALIWLENQNMAIEKNIKKLLDVWTNEQSMGIWAKAIMGIGPVLSAGLLAHIDITKAPTVGHIWRFAGLDPTVSWEKKQKRPWNADLKVLCYKIGESFVKVQRFDDDIYGKFFAQQKKLYNDKNDAGGFKDSAQAVLQKKNFGVDTSARKFYLEGKLPPAHIHAMARRWTVKLFLSHWHGEAYQQHYGMPAPLPYPIAILDHAHMIERPNVRY